VTETVEIVCEEQTVILQQDIQIVEIAPEYFEVVVSAVGARGQTGPAGPESTTPGPPGPAGGTATFIQNIPSSLWVITHGLGYRPNITIVDSGGSRVFSDLQYVDATTILATFSSPFSGVAYLS
jgi:hypothetical protein